MDISLFHSDNDQFVDMRELRAHAARFIQRCPLTTRAAEGDREAAEALHVGFWPFVREFEHAIDRHHLPRGPLVEKFGLQPTRQRLVGLSHAVREMKEEEGSHAAHWLKDAHELELPSLEAPVIKEVDALNKRAYLEDHVEFFACLAGTEFVAEELSRRLVAAPAFVQLFRRQRWIWGEIHLAAHHDGPSHLEIDVDLARAYAAAGQADRIEAAIRDTIDAFELAAQAVNDSRLAFREAA